MTAAREVLIDEALVARLVREQHPEFHGLAVRAVDRQGWDNRTFRLGDEYSVRLPSAEGYVAAVDKERRALTHVSDYLPVQVPDVVAMGEPADGYPYPWSIRRWIDGETLDTAASLDHDRAAAEIGSMLVALRNAPALEGFAAGAHPFYRGAHPSVYTDDVEQALARVDSAIVAAECRRIWADAVATTWQHEPVWFHGDIAAGNVLAQDGRLSALIDFGTCGTGDPACDLVIAWTLFRGSARSAFKDAVALDDDTWRRARGWALWKALIEVTNPASTQREVQRAALIEIFDDAGEDPAGATGGSGD